MISVCVVANLDNNSREYNETAQTFDRKQDIINQNANYLCNKYTFESKDAVFVASEKLHNAGCTYIGKVSVLEDYGNVLSLRIEDLENNIFKFNISKQGNIGPIQDSNGNYLYTPID